MLYEFLVGWIVLYVVYALLYFGVSFLLLRINRTDFGIAHKIQKTSYKIERAPQQQILAALKSLLGIAFLLSLGIVLNRHGYAMFPLLKPTLLSVTCGFILSFLVYDTCFYWMHRLVHHPKLLKSVHRFHHDVHQPVPWTTNSERVLDGLLLNVYWLLAPLLLPIPLEVLVLHRLYDLITGILGHCGHEYSGVFALPPSPLVGVTHHDQHHQFFSCNYAVHFTFWDKWMKTLHKDYEESVRCNIFPPSNN